MDRIRAYMDQFQPQLEKDIATRNAIKVILNEAIKKKAEKAKKPKKHYKKNDPLKAEEELPVKIPTAMSMPPMQM